MIFNIAINNYFYKNIHFECQYIIKKRCFLINAYDNEMQIIVKKLYFKM